MWSSSSVRDIPTISKFFPGFVYNLSHPYPCVILYPLGVVRQKRLLPKLEVYKDDLLEGGCVMNICLQEASFWSI
jgi:hypothetical protein